MRIPRGTPKQGDSYPSVRAWMARLGITHLDIEANKRTLSETAVRDYVSAICGKLPLTLRRMEHTLGRASHKGMTLEWRTVKIGRMTLGTVLHECAHVIASRRKQAANKIRWSKKTNYTGRAPFYPWPGHGEIFCRIYARLLRQHVKPGFALATRNRQPMTENETRIPVTKL